jgi:hypothetical protein
MSSADSSQIAEASAQNSDGEQKSGGENADADLTVNQQPLVNGLNSIAS